MATGDPQEHEHPWEDIPDVEKAFEAAQRGHDQPVERPRPISGARGHHARRQPAQQPLQLRQLNTLALSLRVVV